MVIFGFTHRPRMLNGQADGTVSVYFRWPIVFLKFSKNFICFSKSSPHAMERQVAVLGLHRGCIVRKLFDTGTTCDIDTSVF